MSQVFLSYSRQDEPTARRVAKALEAEGFGVWWDSHLPAHRAYSEVIEKHLHDAKAVVVLWSAAAAQSQWVRAEADFARSEHKLVQASLDGSMPPMPFNQIQCAGLKGWRGNVRHDGWLKIRDSVAAIVSGEEAPRRAAASTRWWAEPRAQWIVAAIGALFLLAGLILMPRVLNRGEADRPVVAVLPFTSPGGRDESLVSGIWDDTRQALSRNPHLLVLGSNTSEELAEKGSSASRKAADYLVEASVRSAGDRIRVSANLVRTDDGAQIWSETFERRLDDVFQLQQDMAQEIEGRIRGRLARGGGVMPQNIATSGEVYALYSEARVKVRKREMGKYTEAAEQLQRVVRMDPNFAPGWATLSVVKKFGVIHQELTGTTPEADARRAIALAPNLAAGHAALGFALAEGPVARAALRRALALDPSDVEAMNWLASTFDRRTQADEILRLYSKIVEIEPLWWPAVLNKTSLLFETGNTAAVEQELARVEQLGDAALSTVIKMELAQRKGDLSAAIDIGLRYYRSASPAEREFIGGSLFRPLIQLQLFDLADRISPPPPNDYIPYLRKNDPRAIGLIEAQLSPKNFWTYGFLPIVAGRVYLLNGEGPRLAKRYHAAASSPEQFMTLVGKDQFAEIAPTAAVALKSAGDEEQARRLLALAETEASRPRRVNGDSQVRLARIYAVQGKTDQAIGLLSSAIRSGWLPPYLPFHTDLALDPPLAELRSDPRFGRLRQEILGHLKKERAELGPLSLD